MGNQVCYAPPTAAGQTQCLTEQIKTLSGEIKSLEDSQQLINTKKAQYDQMQARYKQLTQPQDRPSLQNPKWCYVFEKKEDDEGEKQYKAQFFPTQVPVFYNPKHHAHFMSWASVQIAPHHEAKKAEIKSWKESSWAFGTWWANRLENEPCGSLKRWTEERGPSQFCDCRGLVHASGKVRPDTVDCGDVYTGASSTPFRVTIQNGFVTGMTKDGEWYNPGWSGDPHSRSVSS